MLRGHRMLVGLTIVALGATVGCGQPEFDLALRNGMLVDGTGAAPARVDVGVKADRIAAIGDLNGRRARRDVDARGLIVAPGFIDIQGQSGVTLLVSGNAESHVRQGITSEIIGEVSTPGMWTDQTADRQTLAEIGMAFDWSGFSGYLRTLASHGISINVGSVVPASAVRQDVVGLDDRVPTPNELSRMADQVEQAMTDGGFGLSTALIYPPGSYAKTSELVRLAEAAARHGGIYITHVRGESFRIKAAIGEAFEIGEKARLPVVIYHLKVAARPYWGTMPEIGALIEGARAGGLDVSACQYPYTAGGTGLSACLPGWAQEGGREAMLDRLKDPDTRRRIRRDIETITEGWENLIAGASFEGIQIASVPEGKDTGVVGKRLSELAAERGQDPWETFFSLLLDNDGRVGALYHMMSEDDVVTAMRFPWVSVCTDSAALQPDGPLGRGQPHPRAYGTYPRVLGHYVRERKVLDLVEAVHKMTGLPAQQLHIEERGAIRVGYFADLVMFDPARVKDTATFEKPEQYPEGIELVVVNGVVTVDRGRHTGAHAGRALFGPGVSSGQ